MFTFWVLRDFDDLIYARRMFSLQILYPQIVTHSVQILDLLDWTG